MRTRRLILVTIWGLAFALAAVPALAQQPQPTEQPSATNSAPPQGSFPAAAAIGFKSKKSGGYSTWVKLCDIKENCAITSETLDTNSGLPIVITGVRRIEGDAKEQLIVSLPQTAMRLPAGVRVNVDDGEPVFLAYTHCYGIYCETAADLSKELLGKLRQGRQLTVAFLTLQGQDYALPVDLTGFGKAYDGPSTDAGKYAEARAKLIQAMRQRQAELAAKDSQAATSAGEGPSPSQPQPVYPEGPPNTTVDGSQLAATDADSTRSVEAFCEAAAVSAKSAGADKDGFMSWCRPEAAKLLPSAAP